MTQDLNHINKNADNFPIRESAFYSQIKSSTISGDKASFALIMSMLTTDAKELDEFHLPHTKANQTKSDLYGQFNVAEKKLTGDFDHQRSLKFNELIQQGDKAAVALDLALKPEPLITQPGKLPPEILENLDPNIKCRIKEDAPAEEAKPAVAKVEKEIDVESWFNVLHESRAIATAA